METNTKNLHAEVRALNRIKNPKNLTLLSVRVNRSGELRNARPCPDCMREMLDKGVKVMLYSTEQGEIIRERI